MLPGTLWNQVIISNSSVFSFKLYCLSARKWLWVSQHFDLTGMGLLTEKLISARAQTSSVNLSSPGWPPLARLKSNIRKAADDLLLIVIFRGTCSTISTSSEIFEREGSCLPYRFVLLLLDFGRLDLLVVVGFNFPGCTFILRLLYNFGSRNHVLVQSIQVFYLADAKPCIVCGMWPSGSDTDSNTVRLICAKKL